MQLGAAYRIFVQLGWPIATPVLEGCARDSLNFNPRFGAGQDAFDALQRLVDRAVPSHRG